ncbi:hypothetical protein [Mycolicibacterium sarraceniae]|uniref:hypothetical protein n=1 Tax=Mycolicibacterium sarraceniae TaxID=1534348 RepID=UPI0013D7E31D|nr:hypothetical protein [Mycolicibacterium sarraceniae]
MGKSTVLSELARPGYSTVDTDEGGWIEGATHEVRTDRPLSEVVDSVATIITSATIGR